MKHLLSKGSGLAVIASVAALATTAGTAIAHPVADTLPAGTNLSVSIDTPADGAVLPPGPVTVAGTASVGTGQPNTGLITVIDVSGSTTAGSDCPTPGDTVIDCEKAAAIALNGLAVDAVGEVGAVFFGSNAQAADLDPAAGTQLITTPTADLDGNGERDVEQVIGSAQASQFTDFAGTTAVGGGTSYGNAVTAAVAAASQSSMDRVLVAFLSDGQNLEAPPVSGLEDVAEHIDFHTFAVGTFGCDSDPLGLGSLQDIADGTGGECREVDNIADLPGDLLEAFAAELSGLSLSVDGGPATPITSVTPPLPQEGPADVDYTVDTEPLGPGVHELCVTATGSDAGGNGSVTDCHTVTINAAPQVDPGGPYAGQEGSPVGVLGDVVDPDGPNLTTQWSVAPVTADPGTACAFADPSALATTITCTDDGTFELTLTADDGVNPPVSETTTLELTNEAPVPTITAPADGTLAEPGEPVEFVVPFTDAGSNDTHTCTVDFDDGTPIADGEVDQGAGSGTCTATHEFTTVGAHQVLVRVTDDDGESGTAVVTVVVFLPGEAFAIQAAGPVTIQKTPHATCPPDEIETLAQLNVAIAVVDALNAECTVDPDTGETVAYASIDGASLLGGAIVISNIESSCVSNADGVTRSSRVGTINGVPIGTGSGAISIPLVATVFYNETTTNSSGQLVQNAIRVQTVLGQQIILAGCRLG
ncbi:MAG TPA: PKD domain-containing protein [Natronosporangium sp.]